MVKMLAAAAVLVVLAGCEQQYRYPCHDPANWETPRCQKPLCEINRDCPEHILKGANGNNGNNGNGGISFGPTNNSNQCTQCTNNNTNTNTNNSFVRSDQRGANR